MRAVALVMCLGAQLAWAGLEVCRWEGTANALPSSAVFVPGASSAFGSLSESMGDVQVWPRPGTSLQRLSAVFDLTEARLSVELLPAEPLTLFLQRPLRFGVFTGNDGESVSVRSVSAAGLVEVEATAPEGFTPREPLRAKTACDGLSLFASWSRAAEEPKGQAVFLAPGVEFPIAATAGGTPQGVLLLTQEDAAVVLEYRGDQARIWWDVDEGVFEGWVPASVVSPANVGYGSGVGVLGGKRAIELGALEVDTVHCLQQVTLSVRQGGKVSAIGVLKPSVPFRLKDVTDGSATIDLALPGFELHEGVELVLDPVAWRECR